MYIIVHAVPAYNLFLKKLLFDAFPFHGGQTGRQMWPLRNYFCSFYPFELNVCRMVEFCIPNNHNYVLNYELIIIMFIIIIVNDHNYVFCFFDFNEFWQKNDVARQQNLNFN